MFAMRLDNVTTKNDYYSREVFHCPRYCQVVVMSLRPEESIPESTDLHTCKFIYVVSGKGIAHVQKGDEPKARKHLVAGMSVIIYPGAKFRINNNGNKPLKLFINNVPPVQLAETIRRQAKPTVSSNPEDSLRSVKSEKSKSRESHDIANQSSRASSSRDPNSRASSSRDPSSRDSTSSKTVTTRTASTKKLSSKTNRVPVDRKITKTTRVKKSKSKAKKESEYDESESDSFDSSGSDSK